MEFYKFDSMEGCSSGIGGSSSRSESGYSSANRSNRTVTSSSDEDCAARNSAAAAAIRNDEDDEEYGSYKRKGSIFTGPGKHESAEEETWELPTETDLLDLLKFAYIFQATDLSVGDLTSVASSTHELCHELKDSLAERPILRDCAMAAKQRGPTMRQQRPEEEELEDDESGNGRDTSSKSCSLVEPLRDVLADLAKENLLQSLLPSLLAPPPNQNCDSSSAGFGNGHQTDSDFDPSSGGGGCSFALRASSQTPGGGSRQGKVVVSVVEQGKEEAAQSMKSREITIHICDDGRNEKRDFTCPEDILLRQMGYFKDITSGQSLDDVDISVHCDIAIFEWLMNWIRHAGEDSATPTLEPTNVMSILVSAAFLKMDGLVTIALRYAHNNMNKILAVTPNLNCLGEPLLTKLASLYKPSEVEDLLDRKDRIHSRLYIKLIQALVEPLPQPEREIFYTAASLHRCRLCGMFLTQTLAKLYPCLPLRSSVNRRGEIVPKHQRDPSFNLNDFLKSLRSELKSWRRVFWRLWGMTHPLYCSLCNSHFPVYLNEFCSFHPQDPEFVTLQFKNSSQPFGHFPCCQTPVFRYQSAPRSNQGCQSRDHRVKLRPSPTAMDSSSSNSNQESEIFRLLMGNREAICLSPVRKTGIKIATDANSITLPKSILRHGHCHSEAEESSNVHEICLVPELKRRSLLDRSIWEIALNALLTPALPPSATLRKNASASSLSSNNNNLATTTVVKFAARRWKNIAYGRLKRAPKLPIKVQSSESSTTEDMSEDSSSLEEDDEAGLDYELDSKDLCIEIKVTKEAGDKSKSASSTNLAVKPTLVVSASDGCLSKKVQEAAAANASNNWMCWNADRSTRVNQDNQREMDHLAIRALVKHIGKNQVPKSGLLHHQHHNLHRGDPQHLGSTLTNRTWPNLQLVMSIGTGGGGGSFLRLEQDWRETHVAYLQHRNASAAVAAASASAAVSRTATPAGLRQLQLRPNSAASLRSARLMRTGR